MDDRAKRRLLQRNDLLLHPLITAPDDAARRVALEVIVVEHAVPVIRGVLARYRYPERGLQREDADDIASAVTVRLVSRLRLVAESEDDAIERLPDYVARQTFNAVYDVLRRRFPERTRLRNRLRYVLEHDRRLAAWQTGAGLVAGTPAMREKAEPKPLARLPGSPNSALHDRNRPADAVAALFAHCGHPLLFDELVTFFADLWVIRDTPHAAPDAEQADDQPSQLSRLESRQYLAALWAEICLLLPAQRTALLLNLRDVDGLNAVALFVTAGQVGIDDLSAAIGMSAERLAELWRDLPLDDLTIASMLGLSRQQVINLRRSARERLARRMAKK